MTFYVLLECWVVSPPLRDIPLSHVCQVLWQEERHLPWRRFDECDTEIVFEDGKVFLRARIYHFSRFTLGSHINMESPDHKEKIVHWGFGRRRKEIHVWNATNREIMLIIFPTLFVNQVTENSDQGISLMEKLSIHYAASRAFDQGLFVSGMDPQIRYLPAKREEAGGACPHIVISLAMDLDNKAIVSLMTYDANLLSVWDYQCLRRNTRFVVLPRKFECIRPALGIHRCDEDSDFRRVVLQNVVERLPRRAPMSRITR